jgi:hypothetical protein
MEDNNLKFNTDNVINLAIMNEKLLRSLLDLLIYANKALEGKTHCIPITGDDYIDSQTSYIIGAIDKLKEASKVDKKEKDTPEWKKDFNVYKNDLYQAFEEIKNDREWIEKQERLNKNLDVVATIEKGIEVYWGVEDEGYKRKKKEKTKVINWRNTFAKNLDKNRVFKPLKKENSIDDVLDSIKNQSKEIKDF